MDIESLDIPVNAVATALKDFFSKRLPALFDDSLMNELEDIAGKYESVVWYHRTIISNPMFVIQGSRGIAANALSMEVKTDRSCRLLALRALLNKMPPINFAILKYIFHHFVR